MEVEVAEDTFAAGGLPPKEINHDNDKRDYAGWRRQLDDATRQPIVYPSGTLVDVWGGEIQSAEFELG